MPAAMPYQEHCILSQDCDRSRDIHDTKEVNDLMNGPEEKTNLLLEKPGSGYLVIFFLL